MKLMKKSIALLLVLCMVLSLLPAGVLADDGALLTPPTIAANTRTQLRQTADWNSGLERYSGASVSIPFTGATSDWTDNITSITLTPIDADGTPTDTGDLEYPNAPKEITLTSEDRGTWDEKDGKWIVDGTSIVIYRTSDEPVVYVMEGHEPIEITGRWSTNVYPQSQIYQVTVKADGYADSVSTITYYTGTATDFSIIEDVDGVQTVLATWTSEEIAERATFANGSSQCGMTGFRSFSGLGVSLNDLLEEAGVEVSEDDYFLLDTSDHYGNNFTYDELFNTTRYFIQSIYDDPEVWETYQELVSSDDEAGATLALRQLLAAKALEDESTIEPRINVTYDEVLIYGNQLGTAVLPTEDNFNGSSLVSYENQYRFFYGIAIEDSVTLKFDTGDGSNVVAQTHEITPRTSTSNTTIKSSYWANSLVIYRGAGEAYKAEESVEVDAFEQPEAPTREGYIFGGWYTDKNCTAGKEFNFETDGASVDVDTTLYAKWIPTITITDFDITSAEHDDADEELNQTIIATITFSDDIELTAETLSEDLLISIGTTSDANTTARDITYEVQNGNQLVITMVSTDWVAIYSGMLKIAATAAGITNIVAADGEKAVVWTDQSGQIPIGIVVSNDAIAGTASKAATTFVSVDHKANMRGMYFFELVSIDADGKETVIGSSVSHAHNFYTSIDEAAIAKAMSDAINGFEGYSTDYSAGDTFFIVTADEPVAGQTLAVRMVELKAEINYAHASDKYADAALVQGAWWHKAIEYVTINGYMNGSNDSGKLNFNPSSNIRRSEFVVVLYGMAGKPETKATNQFTDLALYGWAEPSINWAAETGITKGIGNGKFGPEQYATREQLAGFLYKYAEFMGYDVTGSANISGYKDVDDVSSWAEKSVKWAVANGIMGANSTLNPKDNATRAEIATMILAFCTNVEKADTTESTEE